MSYQIFKEFIFSEKNTNQESSKLLKDNFNGQNSKDRDKIETRRCEIRSK